MLFCSLRADLPCIALIFTSSRGYIETNKSIGLWSLGDWSGARSTESVREVKPPNHRNQEINFDEYKHIIFS
jgi:hypothetical protein